MFKNFTFFCGELDIVRAVGKVVRNGSVCPLDRFSKL